MALNGNTLPYVPTAATPAQQIAAINRVIDKINSFQQQIVISDGSTKRLIIGFQKDGFGIGKDFGIKISQDGIDVSKATPEQLIFSMDMDTWRWYDPTGRNFANIGKRAIGTYGFEMAKPGSELSDPS